MAAKTGCIPGPEAASLAEYIDLFDSAAECIRRRDLAHTKKNGQVKLIVGKSE